MLHWVHVGLIFASLFCFLVAVVCAALYLFQSGHLKSKHLTKAFFGLPSLIALDKVHFVACGWGVVLFSLALISGFVWASGSYEIWQLWGEPDILLSLVTCFLYWAILGLRASWTRGKKIAAGTLVIFILLSITVISTYCPVSLVHQGKGI